MGLFVVIARRSATDHLHDDVILLLRPESFRVLLSCTNYVICYFNLAGITNLNNTKGKTERILVMVVK